MLKMKQGGLPNCLPQNLRILLFRLANHYIMKHKTINEQLLGEHKIRIEIELIPENETERSAVLNIQHLTSTPEQKDFIENYLHFSLS